MAITLLEKNINYKFRDKSLASLLVFVEPVGRKKKAKRHETPTKRTLSTYERLGDALLSFLLFDLLLSSTPNTTVSELCDHVAHIASNSTLTKFGKSLKLPSLTLCRGDSAVANTVEVLIGLMYRDGGYAEVISLVKRLIEFSEGFPSQVKGKPSHKDTLHRTVERLFKVCPQYITIEQDTYKFKCTLIVNNKTYGPFFGESKKSAENCAAKAALMDITD